jgi:cobalt/nickel transport system permease protein
MHIPDGYISPQTAVAMYAAAAPFWFVASRRLKKALSSRMVPLIAVFAAFSFVIMMFNIPLPGGPSAHATGAALMAIILGPWAAIIGVTIALVIQAVLFGDGGILALGANVFNIAVVIPLVSYVIYRAIAARSPLNSPRRTLAAAVGGYLGLNAGALMTAFVLGIQPLLFHTADGMPLYNPYPLQIALPAMMLPHLLIIGVAEAVVTAGVVAYLQRTNLSLLEGTPKRKPKRKEAAA